MILWGGAIMKEGEWPGEVVEGVGQWTGPQRARPGPHQGMVHYSFYSSLKYIQLGQLEKFPKCVQLKYLPNHSQPNSSVNTSW